MSIACDIDHHMHVMHYFLEIVSYKPPYSSRKYVNIACENLKDIRNIGHKICIHSYSQNFDKPMLMTKSSLAKLTTYNKFILLLFSITNKFDEMKYNISRVRTFANPISIISQYRYTKCVVQCNFTIVSFMGIWSQHNPSK